MDEFFRIPPSIIHDGRRPKKFDDVIDDFGANTHLGPRAIKLLKYYASCSNGFKPALALIEQSTGIPSNKVSEIRAELVKRAVISYIPQRSIVIHWPMILTLAGLSDSLPMRGARYSFNCLQINGQGLAGPTIGNMMGADGRKCRCKPGSKESFFNYLKSLTLSEYNLFSSAVLNQKPTFEDNDYP